MRLWLGLAAAMLFLFPAASAATVGEVTTWAEPDFMTIDPRKHIQREGQEPERQFFDVHLEARIECRPLIDGPVPLFVEASGTGRLSEQSEGTTYFDYGPRNFTVQWTSQGGGVYTAAHVETVTIISDGAPPGNGLTANITWNSAQAEFQGTTRCDPEGYAWVSNSTPHEVFVPGTGDLEPGQTDTETGGDNGTPVGPVVPFMALALAALAARRRKRER